MDIVKTFSAHINAPKNSIRREISNSPEVQISKKYNDLDDNLGKLRGQTVKFSYIDSKGAMKIKEDPAYASLQKQIQGEEARLRKLREIADEIGIILESHKVAGIYELHDIRDQHVATIQSGPVRCWDEFRLYRERPKWQNGYPDLLPSELAKIESYRGFEDKIRAGMDAAKAALEPINASLQKLDGLVAEVESL